MSAIATARFWHLVRSGRLATRGRPVARFLRSGGLRPKKISFPRLANQRVMPRVFRRGFGLGGMIRRRKRRMMGKRVYRKKTQNKVHTYIRWCDKDTTYVTPALGPNLIQETGLDQNLTYQFKLDNVVNPSDFTNLYDQYRINKVVLYLERQSVPNGGQYVTGLPNKKLRVVHDYTDANPLTQEDDYLEYSNCKSYSANRNIAITLYPKIKNVVENKDGSPNAYTVMSSNRVWLDIAEDEVPHFGLKIFIPQKLATLDGDLLYRVRAKMWLSLRQSK